MPVNFYPHEIVMDPDSQLPRVIHRADYISLTEDDEQVYVQGGKIFLGGGDAVHPDEAPAWFWDRYAQLTPHARRSCGLELPQDRVRSMAELPTEFLQTLESLDPDLREKLLQGPPEKAPRMPVEAPKIPDETPDLSSYLDALTTDPRASRPTHWTCDVCAADVEVRKKGVHIAAHRRAAARRR